MKTGYGNLLLVMQWQLAVGMSSSGIVLSKQVDGTENFTVGNNRSTLIAVSVVPEVLAHTEEIEMRLNDCLAGCEVSACQEVKGCCRIQQTSPVHDGAELLFRHVLVE